MKKTTFLFSIILGMLTCLGPIACNKTAQTTSVEHAKVFNVKTYGAVGDGVTMDTEAIQRAIDACLEAGSGVVLVPEGKYHIGTLKLGSNLELRLEENCELLGSESIDDYARDIIGAIEAPAFDECVLFAANAKNIKLTGKGTINGRGYPENFPEWINKEKKQLGDRPMLIRFVDCQNITFEGVTLKNAASWCTHMVDCDDIVIRNIHLDSKVHKNNDGFDLDGCKNILIEDSVIHSGDDSICPKSTTSRICENLVVRNCRVSSHTAAFKCGTSSRGGFRNMTISDCDFSDTRMGCIKLLTVDGGILENITIENIVANNVEGPIFIRLANRGRTYEAPTEQIYGQDVQAESTAVGSVKNVVIRNFKATVSGDIQKRQGIMISGIPGHMIEDVLLENVEVRYTGGGTEEDAKIVVAEDIARYPEQFFFGVLPSWGAYIRHARNVEFKNVKLSTVNPDKREKTVLVDVEGFEESI